LKGKDSLSKKQSAARTKCEIKGAPKRRRGYRDAGAVKERQGEAGNSSGKLKLNYVSTDSEARRARKNWYYLSSFGKLHKGHENY